MGRSTDSPHGVTNSIASHSAVPQRRVSLFVPCYVDQLFPRVAQSTVLLLERLGVACEYDERQTCCGQPAFNSGYADAARRVAEHFVSIFSGCETIVAPGGSCVSMVRNHFAHVLGREEPVTLRVRELCEYLVNELGAPDVGASLPGRAALHMPCHMLRDLDGASPVREILSRVRGLEIVDLPCDTWCCGFGGTFSVKYPELSTAMSETKLQQMRDAGVDYLISPESSCLMQLAGVLQRSQDPAHPRVSQRAIRPLHVAEVLAGTIS
ncbi:MAG: Fe-S oxidoreductase [Phycisphaerae bacterium]|nr:MAG: (Fe-S)-binding protein [Planctomycetia bacterium]GJQ25295.1 MAG: Fe-S oxidoreductase [Phycisphaerae bacterium]